MEHLVGLPVPPLRLTATAAHGVDLTGVGTPWAVLCVLAGGAEEAASFSEAHEELAGLGAEVYGVSSQAPDVQRETAERLGLPFVLLSDPHQRLSEELGFPPDERLALVVRHARVVQVFHPLPQPAEVARWLREEADAAA